MTDASGYAVYAVRYGTRVAERSGAFLNYEIYGRASRNDAAVPGRRTRSRGVEFLLGDGASYMTGKAVSADGGAAAVSIVRPSGGAGAWDAGAYDAGLYGATKGIRMSDQSTRRVGFVGLGNMGGRITRRLVDGGVPVLGYDVQTAAVGKKGATAAKTLAEVAQESDVILLSLPNTSVVEKVVRAPEGLLANARAGQIVVDLSTSSPRSTIALHAQFQERDVEFVDAGISGGAAAAEKGALTIMAGGSRAALDSIDWLFAPIATKVFHLGAPGAGHSAKVLNNFLNAVSLAATAEVMVAAKKAGLDLFTLLEVLNSSSGVNFATINRFPNIARGDYMEGGLSGTLMLKDVGLYVDYVAGLGVPTLNASGPLASFGLSNSLGYADLISNRVVDAIGDVSGGVRLHDSVDKGAKQ